VISRVCLGCSLGSNLNEDDLVKRDIESRISGLAIRKRDMDKAYETQQYQVWMRLQDEYNKARDQTLKVFKILGRTEQELDKLLSEAVEKLRQQ
jgi:hypothetical protein